MSKKKVSLNGKVTLRMKKRMRMMWKKRKKTRHWNKTSRNGMGTREW